jgi:hypothetical protein
MQSAVIVPDTAHESSAMTPPTSGDVITIGGPDMNRERYPCSVVWTPIPLITWVLPFVGHMGIADSNGVVFDFAGPYYVGEDCLAFGNPTKYLPLSDTIMQELTPGIVGTRTSPTSEEVSYPITANTTLALKRYDEAIYDRKKHFRKSQMYNFFTNNCHTFAACCLVEGEVGKRAGRSWNMVTLCALVFFCGKHVSFWRAVKTYLPFTVIVGLILFFSLAF